MNDNGKQPAFPSEIADCLTKREYFAGLAMQGLLATNSAAYPEGYANAAVRYADALLAELAKTEKP